MNKLSAAVAALGLALSVTAFAQDPAEVAAARQQRMDAAYVAHRDAAASPRADVPTRRATSSSGSVREDARRAGHAVHQGLLSTGHAIHQGVRATGHAIHRGVRATGHAIHRGVDKVTGK